MLPDDAPDSGLPPGPDWSPLGSTLRWMLRPVPMMEGCRRRYGRSFTVRFLHEGTTVLISDPADVRTVFTAPPTTLHAGEGRVLMKPIFGENSLLSIDEDAHREQRRLLLPPFHGERLTAFAEVMAEVTRAEIAGCELGRPIRLAPRLRSIALEIILRVVFATHGTARAAALREAMTRLLDLTSSVPRMLPLIALGPKVTRLPRMRRMLDDVDSLIYDEIEARRREPDLAERTDVLSMLLSSTHVDGSRPDPVEVRDQLVTILIGGHETTATALAWAVETLARAPQVMERLRQEAESGEDAYLDAVVKETLRIRPVLPVLSRLVKEPLELSGHTIPPGTIVAVCTYLTHHDPAIYPDPYRFRPERFLDSPAGTYTWIPFGGGVRRCIGSSFSVVEMKSVLRVLSEELRISAAQPAAERVARRAITLVPERGCEVVLERLKPTVGSAIAGQRGIF